MNFLLEGLRNIIYVSIVLFVASYVQNGPFTHRSYFGTACIRKYPLSLCATVKPHRLQQSNLQFV